MSGDFVLKSSGTQFMFNLRAGNREIILTSERYSSKTAAQEGIESVKKNAPADSLYDRQTAKDGSPYFTLKATNGLVIGKSEMYSSAAARDKGIDSVKASAPGAATRDET